MIVRLSTKKPFSNFDHFHFKKKPVNDSPGFFLLFIKHHLLNHDYEIF
jgi:hypothetical protein